MKIGILKEIKENEKRVSITPSVVSKIKKLGHEIIVQENAGLSANYSNKMYEEKGAHIANRTSVLKSDVIIKINKPIDEEGFKYSSIAVGRKNTVSEDLIYVFYETGKENNVHDYGGGKVAMFNIQWLLE